MNITLLKALIALIPMSMLVAWSLTVFMRAKTVGATLQLVGATCLLVVVLTHAAEGVHLLPFMHWGEQHSVGHYLDLSSAVLGLALFPIGYVLRARAKRTSS